MKDIDLAQNERMCNFSTLVRCNKKHVISKNDLMNKVYLGDKNSQGEAVDVSKLH